MSEKSNPGVERPGSRNFATFGEAERRVLDKVRVSKDIYNMNIVISVDGGNAGLNGMWCAADVIHPKYDVKKGKVICALIHEEREAYHRDDGKKTYFRFNAYYQPKFNNQFNVLWHGLKFNLSLLNEFEKATGVKVDSSQMGVSFVAGYYKYVEPLLTEALCDEFNLNSGRIDYKTKTSWQKRMSNNWLSFKGVCYLILHRLELSIAGLCDDADVDCYRVKGCFINQNPQISYGVGEIRRMTFSLGGEEKCNEHNVVCFQDLKRTAAIPYGLALTDPIKEIPRVIVYVTNNDLSLDFSMFDDMSNHHSTVLLAAASLGFDPRTHYLYAHAIRNYPGFHFYVQESRIWELDVEDDVALVTSPQVEHLHDLLDLIRSVTVTCGYRSYRPEYDPFNLSKLVIWLYHNPNAVGYDFSNNNYAKSQLFMTCVKAIYNGLQSMPVLSKKAMDMILELVPRTVTNRLGLTNDMLWSNIFYVFAVIMGSSPVFLYFTEHGLEFGPTTYKLLVGAQVSGCRLASLEDIDRYSKTNNVIERVSSLFECVGKSELFNRMVSNWRGADFSMPGQVVNVEPITKVRQFLTGKKVVTGNAHRQQ